MPEMLELFKRRVLWELLEEYPDVQYFDKTDLIGVMQDIYQSTKRPFVVIVDEWDCVFREYREERKAQEEYLDFLRDLLKDRENICLAYITGILPIKKYGTHSALNMFSEYSMMNPRQLARFAGFTQEEAEELCRRYHMDSAELKEWYDGYYFSQVGSVYSPKSVVEAVTSGVCDSYWSQTETFEALRMNIDMNFEGLKDDVLTLLIHLGYLGYDFNSKRVYIPNNEVWGEYVTAVSVSQWGEVSKALIDSAKTLQAIWQKRPKSFAGRREL